MSLIEEWLRSKKLAGAMKVDTGIDEPLDKAVDTVKEIFDCAICRSPLTVPMQTSCGHLFCNFCLQELCNVHSVPCPLCKVKISTRGSVERGDVEEIRDLVTKLCGIVPEEMKLFMEGTKGEDPVNVKGRKEEDRKVDLEDQHRYVGRAALVADWLNNNKAFIKEKTKTEISLERAMDMVKDHMNCAICDHPLNVPMQTSCGHLFCNECLQKLCKASHVPCPMCTSKISTKGLTEREDVKDMNKCVTKLCGAFHAELQQLHELDEKENLTGSRETNSLSQNQTKHYVFCPTRLNKAQTQKLQELSQLCNGTVSRDFSGEVTHLVLNLNNGRVPQTLKYLLAIAGRKWVVTFDWVDECLEKGAMVSEDNYETSNFEQCDPGVKQSRLSKTNLFDGFNFYFASDHFKRVLGFTMEEILMLMESLGATVITSPARFDGNLLIVGAPKENETEYYHWLHTEKWLTITFGWIIECILEYKLKPILDTHLCIRVTDATLQSANVPKSLQRTISQTLSRNGRGRFFKYTT